MSELHWGLQLVVLFIIFVFVGVVGVLASHILNEGRRQKYKNLFETGCKMDEIEEAEMGEHILQFFDYDHLPLYLQEVSKPFAELAYHIRDNVNHNPERTAALRKLLESKDAAVRAALSK